MDSDDDLDLMQAAHLFGVVALLNCLNQALLELARFHAGQPGPWLDDLQQAYKRTVEQILSTDKARRADEADLVAYVHGIIESLIGGVRNTLTDSAVPRSFPPRRIVVNLDDVSVRPGHKPYHLSDFGAESPFAIIRADTVGPETSGRPPSDTGPNARLPAPVAGPGLAMLTMGYSLATTLHELSRHHGGVPGPWLDELTQSFDQRLQGLRASGFSEGERTKIVNVARNYALGACSKARHDIAKSSQAA